MQVKEQMTKQALLEKNNLVCWGGGGGGESPAEEGSGVTSQEVERVI